MEEIRIINDYICWGNIHIENICKYIILIGRYNFDINKRCKTGDFIDSQNYDKIKSTRYPRARITYMTAHSSKGLGFDNVIIRQRGDNLQGYNCIIVYHKNMDRLLFCKRVKDPYKGLYNLVGGKIEDGEEGYVAAYRELEEETGITDQDILLHHMMDFTYYNEDCYLEVYAGVLTEEILTKEEANPLLWIDINENFFDLTRFAGEGNIGHMVEQVKCYGMGIVQKHFIPRVKVEIDTNCISIGVDGCKGGWICAALDHGNLIVDRFDTVKSIVDNYPEFDEFLIDMVIGLPSSLKHVRPDAHARKMIRERTSTIFPSPCRQAVYAATVAKAYEENERVLGKKFTPLSVGIIPKMREIDIFLQENPQFKNIMKESHPEVCFAMLNGKTVLSKKSDIEGMEERVRILKEYISEIDLKRVTSEAKKCKCSVDDILDAISLAVTGNLVVQDMYRVIPDNPMEDETGLKMQMIIPRL